MSEGPVEDLSALRDALSGQRVVARGSMPDGQVAFVREAIERWDDRGRRAYVLSLRRGDALPPYRALFEQLSLDPASELLLLFNGVRWEARGWGLSPGEVEQTLDAAEGALHGGAGRGLSAGLDALAEASSPPVSATQWALGGSAAALMVGGGLGWIVMRRNRRIEAARTRVRVALDSAEQVFAHVMLEAEALDDDTATQLQLQAAQLKTRLEAVTAEMASPQVANDVKMRVQRVQDVHNDLVQLRTELDHRLKQESTKGAM